VEGKRCRVKIYAGEPILASKLLGPDESLGAAKEIPPGYRVAHVTVDGAVGSNNLILPGDRVDVLVFRNTGSNEMHATASKIVLQDIKVFAVNTHTETQFSQTKVDQSEPITARTIALLVTPRQSEILHAATEMAGSIRLVLRNPDDDSHYVSEGATISDIFGPEEKTERDGEKTADTQSPPATAITDWLKGQNGATPPAQPPVPTFPVVASAPGSKMIVLYGSELMTVEIPADGSPPINPTAKGSGMPATFGGSGLPGGAMTPLPPAANPPGDGGQPPSGSNDSIDGEQEGSIDSNQEGTIDGTQQGGIDSNQGGGSIDSSNGEFIEDQAN
jgi:Flp pilus assembly protein CpaB